MKTTISPSLRSSRPSKQPKPSVKPISLEELGLSLSTERSSAVERSKALTQLHTPDYRKQEKELAETLPFSGLKLELNIARDLVLSGFEAYRAGKIKSAMTLFANACTASDAEEFMLALEGLVTPEQGAGQKLDKVVAFPEILPAVVDNASDTKENVCPPPIDSSGVSTPPTIPTSTPLAPALTPGSGPAQVVVNISGTSGLRSISASLEKAEAEDADADGEGLTRSGDLTPEFESESLPTETENAQEVSLQVAELTKDEGLQPEDVLSDEDSSIPNEKMVMRSIGPSTPSESV